MKLKSDMKNLVFGLDIGGTGIKGGIVNVKEGRMESERLKIATPQPATPKNVAKATHSLIEHFNWDGPVGVGFPAIIKHDVCFTATNIDKSWIGKNVSKVLKKETNLSFTTINDADAAALCELHYGAAKGIGGLVMLTTIGTGIGCGLLYEGKLVPNCELGVTYLDNGTMLEKYSSNAARKREQLDWKSYTKRLNKALLHIDRLTSPDLFILGGGMAKKIGLLKPYLDNRLNIVPAQFQNEAGTIGAAMASVLNNKK